MIAYYIKPHPERLYERSKIQIESSLCLNLDNEVVRTGVKSAQGKHSFS